MKYSWEFVVKYVENYKRGICTSVHENRNTSQGGFCISGRSWIRVFDIHGIDAFKHKTENRVWIAEEKYDLVAKGMVRNSIKSTTIESGINAGQFYAWINKYNHLGQDGLKCTKRGHLSEKELSVIKNDNSSKELSKNEREELITLRRRNEYLKA